MPSYRIVHADDDDRTLDTLTERVNELLDEGWKCTGGVSVNLDKKGNLLAAFQAMIKN
jgi:hypothetical protein